MDRYSIAFILSFLFMLYLCWFGYFWEWIFHFILIHPRWIGIVSNRHNVTKTLRASRLWEHTQQSHCIHLTQPPHKFLTVHWKQGSSQQAPTTPVHCKMAHGVCVSMVNGFVPLTNKKLKSPDRKAVLQPSSPAVSAQFKCRLHLPSSFYQLQKFSKDSGILTSGFSFLA